jgi:hypothetical protein
LFCLEYEKLERVFKDGNLEGGTIVGIDKEFAKTTLKNQRVALATHNAGPTSDDHTFYLYAFCDVYSVKFSNSPQVQALHF